MNSDFMIQDIGIREKQYRKNINSKGDTRYYDDSCKNIKKYAYEQNTVYDPNTNQILYGINTNMRASGVSDGTCNQINPLLFTPRYICGAGAAGGNRCVQSTYPQAYPSELNYNFNSTNPQEYLIENFDPELNSNKYNITQLVIFILLVLVLIGFIYSKNKNIEL